MELSAEKQTPEKVYKVAELTRLIRAVLEGELGEVWVEGELSNVRKPASGHWYFTLKDASAQLRCVMFRGDSKGAQAQPEDGLKVRVFGRITVYEAGGQYQLVARRLQPAGRGDLQAAFEALKKKLKEEGLFEPGRKRPLPMLPRHIGVVTSPTGAAIRDIFSVLLRRFPNIHLLLAPVKVQGAGAAAEIAAAIDALNARGGLDVLIVGRGGGSLEDLWPFNEEIVARAIARSAVPVISAVGHEIDFTISDFVADLRAPTPSAAAELVIGRKADFERGLSGLLDRLAGALSRRALEFRGRFDRAAGSYVFREPGNLAARGRDRLARLRLQLASELRRALASAQQKADEYDLRLAASMREACRTQALVLRRHEAQLRALSPLAVLERGYSMTLRHDGLVVRSPADVSAGDCISTRLAGGTIESEVK